MSWNSSLSTYVWVFSVGRGNAAFVRSGLNQGSIVDMGKGNDFDPASFVKEQLVPKLDRYKGNMIAQALLSHPHADHIAQCGELKSDELAPALLTCPHDKDHDENTPSSEKLNWDRIEHEDSDHDLLDTYRSLYGKRALPLQTICYESRRTIPNLEYGIYYIRPPVCECLHEEDDNRYGNSTSIMYYFRHGAHSVLLPGDMTPEGMKQILDEGEGVEKRYTVFDNRSAANHPTWHKHSNSQPCLKSMLQERGLSILVAPHHGLESCFSEDLYAAIKKGKPQLVVISERKHKKTSDGRVDPRYQSERGASGLTVEIDGKQERRRSVSTIDGHHIMIVFAGTGLPRVYASKDPEELVEIACC